MLTKKYTHLKWWQIAILSVAVSALGALASGLSSGKQKKLYNTKLRQAPWAPPAWVFAPAWNINNFFLLLALQRLLMADVTEKKKLLVLQAMMWVIFFSFGYVYFRKRSPLLAAAWTMADAGLACASFIIAFKGESKTAYYYLPLVVWTGFASTLAGYQALVNDDPVLKTKALVC